MSAPCCEKKCGELDILVKRQTKVLWIVLFLNLLMFFVEFSYSFLTRSFALMGDSLDMMGDALAYGSSLYVVNKGLREKLLASKFKAYLMILTGVVTFIMGIYRFIEGVPPHSALMGIIGGIALAVNLFCLYLLSSHKDDDLNFKSVWLCSRNDIVANLSVLLAAYLVHLTGSPYPDLLVGLGITVLFLKSGIWVLKESGAQ